VRRRSTGKINRLCRTALQRCAHRDSVEMRVGAHAHCEQCAQARPKARCRPRPTALTHTANSVRKRARRRAVGQGRQRSRTLRTVCASAPEGVLSAKADSAHAHCEQCAQARPKARCQLKPTALTHTANRARKRARRRAVGRSRQRSRTLRTVRTSAPEGALSAEADSAHAHCEQCAQARPKACFRPKPKDKTPGS
jgi:hypothetical protein